VQVGYWVCLAATVFTGADLFILFSSFLIQFRCTSFCLRWLSAFLPLLSPRFTQALECDLLHPDPAVEAKKHKLKRLVQSPNSFFMDVKCPGCFTMYVWPSVLG